MASMLALVAFAVSVLSSHSLPLRGGGLSHIQSRNSMGPDKLLALRGGGVSNEQLINSMAGLYIITGLQGWLAPKTTLSQYGVSEITETESAYLRILSGMNVVMAVS